MTNFDMIVNWMTWTWTICGHFYYLFDSIPKLQEEMIYLKIPPNMPKIYRKFNIRAERPTFGVIVLYIYS